MKKVYISGQITGLTEKEVETKFLAGELEIINKGHVPVNPLDLPHNHDKSWASYMKKDIIALMDCDAIYMLDNWARSEGARIEHSLAKKLGIEIIYQPSKN